MTHQPRTEETVLIRQHKRRGKRQRSDWRGYPTDGQGPWLPDAAVVDPTAPRIDAISPTAVSVAAPGASVNLTGINFSATSVIEIDGVAQTTIFNDATWVSVVYDPTTTGVKIFRVRDGAKLSNPINFTVNAATTADFQSKTKAEIVAWLMGEGVNIDESAITRFTKDELIAIVDAYLNGDTDPVPSP